jgi:L-cysteate sulfo-lyase
VADRGRAGPGRHAYRDAGAVQSNHVRQTAAVAAMFGMKCTALLEHRIETNDRDYLNSGNVLLDRLFGCAIEYRPVGST